MPQTTECVVFTAADVRRLLRYRDCIAVIERVMPEVSRRNVQLPLRQAFQVAGGAGMFGVMNGAVGTPAYFGSKLISMFPGNIALGLVSHVGVFVLFDGKSGLPVALLEGGTLTAIRTAAATAVATRHLARADSRRLAMIGTGEEAQTHLEALQEIYALDEILVWGRNRAKAAALVSKNAGKLNTALRVVDSIDAAAAAADIICTVTSAKVPILFGRQLRAGQHINLVGSSIPTTAEADSDAVMRSRYFVDYRESALAQAGELLNAIQSGLLTADHIRGEIGSVIAGDIVGRESASDITVYKSLGIAAQDIAAAAWIYEQARDDDSLQRIRL
ncbi:MAG: ornithine cyclodeaminase family protein [Pseudomonadales bacterium]|nr:ornithine cyclodeaminase family protein [Pseudomonadales bacterium]